MDHYAREKIKELLEFKARAEPMLAEYEKYMAKEEARQLDPPPPAPQPVDPPASEEAQPQPEQIADPAVGLDPASEAPHEDA